MPDELPYMRLWVGDLQADLMNMGLTDEEFGVYMRLLLVAWKDGCIPADLRKLPRLVSATPRRFAALWPSIEHKWESNGNGGLVNPRQERERKAALTAHAKRVAAGRKGGKAKAKQS
jgi:uncharacterized protein YdaU (DUF1376 family)